MALVDDDGSQVYREKRLDKPHFFFSCYIVEVLLRLAKRIQCNGGDNIFLLSSRYCRYYQGLASNPQVLVKKSEGYC